MTRDHFCRHRIRDNILNDRADHQQHCAKHIKIIGASKGEPTPGGAGKDHKTGNHQQRSDDDVRFALRAEDRHGVHEFAEHHFHCPGQSEPDADSRELRGRERQALLDPEVAGDID